ncbi:MAG: hypothetical protein ACE3JN_04030 [Ectobacillus sp.]
MRAEPSRFPRYVQSRVSAIPLFPLESPPFVSDQQVNPNQHEPLTETSMQEYNLHHDR